jgi:hypothetical protein
MERLSSSPLSHAHLSTQDQDTLDEHLKQAAAIVKKHTDPQKLNDFETLEVELRDQMLSVVSPTIADFF